MYNFTFFFTFEVYKRDSMKLLENKVAIVTGGSRGIGEAICYKLAAQGANVAFTYLSSEEKAKAVAEKINAMGVKAKAYQSDAADYASSENFVKQVLEDFGQVDILVNNAGISKDNLLIRMSDEEWSKVITANLNSVFNVTKQVLKPMMKARSGSIINMSSIVGMQGNAGQASYAASKAGIIGFTKSVAKELGGRNIRSNAIAPGFIETDMTGYLKDGQIESWTDNIPLKRLGQTDDIADVVVFLASDMSRYMTGQVLSVCGGLNI